MPKSKTLAIPDPFEPAPSSLAPLLATLDPQAVYITHIDRHPAWFKKRIFLVPLGLNVGIALLVLWRGYVATPMYWAILMSVLGNANETTIYWASTAWGGLVRQVGWRAAVFLMDWMLATVVAPWPYSFFAESPANPVSWRFSVGFRDAEVYVRQSRGWGADDLLGSAKAGAESPFFKTRILPAVDRRRLIEKTGYLLMDKNFDLDFAAMVTATQLVDTKRLDLDQLRTSVFVCLPDAKWLVWNCGKLDDDADTVAREKIILFKDSLTRMGKESLFFAWVELVQYESSAPGGFTPERQQQTVDKARRLFEKEGVDFDHFVNHIGGLKGLPGMD